MSATVQSLWRFPSPRPDRQKTGVPELFVNRKKQVGPFIGAQPGASATTAFTQGTFYPRHVVVFRGVGIAESASPIPMPFSMRLVKSRRSKDSCSRSGRLAAGFNRSLQRLNNTRPSPLDGTLLLLGVGRNKATSGSLDPRKGGRPCVRRPSDDKPGQG